MPETTPAPAVQEAENATITAPSSAPAVDMTLPAGEKMLAVLGYIGFLCILPLALKPKSELCQHHGKQALAITIPFFIVTAVLSNFALFAFSSIALIRFGVFIKVLWVVFAVLGIMGAAAGKKNNIPFFSTIAQRFTW